MARCATLAIRIGIPQHQTYRTLNIIGQVFIATGVPLLVGIYATMYLDAADILFFFN